MNIDRILRRTATVGALAAVVWGVGATNGFAQTKTTAKAAASAATGELEAAESMGIGQKSRFYGGATPITIDRSKIVPGTPLSVNSTMTKIISSDSGNSFGGILARYDVENFGKFFGTGSLTPRTTANRVAALDGVGDNAVENDVEVARMYPPRLTIDFNEFPSRALGSDEARANLKLQIENVASRFDVDPKVERLRVESEGTAVYLRGKLRNARFSRLLENVVGMQPGVERVVNEIEVLEPETRNVDVFGRPLLSTTPRQ